MKIAIVEDDPAHRAALALELDVPGRATVSGAYADAESALRDLPLAWPDVALVDLGLPGMDGTRLITRLRALAPNLVCVVHTSREEPAHIVAALKAGAVGYLLKDAPAADILRALEEAVAGGAPLSRSVARQVLGHVAASAPTLQSDDYVQVKTGPGAMRFVRIPDVVLLASQDNYTELHLAKGERLLVRSTLASWEERLPSTHFLRVHRQAILNVAAVEGFEHQTAEITLLRVAGLAEPVRARRDCWDALRARLTALGRPL